MSFSPAPGRLCADGKSRLTASGKVMVGRQGCDCTGWVTSSRTADWDDPMAVSLSYDMALDGFASMANWERVLPGDARWGGAAITAERSSYGSNELPHPRKTHHLVPQGATLTFTGVAGVVNVKLIINARSGGEQSVWTINGQGLTAWGAGSDPGGTAYGIDADAAGGEIAITLTAAGHVAGTAQLAAVWIYTPALLCRGELMPQCLVMEVVGPVDVGTCIPLGGSEWPFPTGAPGYPIPEGTGPFAGDLTDATIRRYCRLRGGRDPDAVNLRALPSACWFDVEGGASLNWDARCACGGPVGFWGAAYSNCGSGPQSFLVDRCVGGIQWVVGIDWDNNQLTVWGSLQLRSAFADPVVRDPALGDWCRPTAIASWFQVSGLVFFGQAAIPAGWLNGSGEPTSVLSITNQAGAVGSTFTVPDPYAFVNHAVSVLAHVPSVRVGVDAALLACADAVATYRLADVTTSSVGGAPIPDDQSGMCGDTPPVDPPELPPVRQWIPATHQCAIFPYGVYGWLPYPKFGHGDVVELSDGSRCVIALTEDANFPEGTPQVIEAVEPPGRVLDGTIVGRGDTMAEACALLETCTNLLAGVFRWRVTGVEYNRTNFSSCSHDANLTFNGDCAGGAPVGLAYTVVSGSITVSGCLVTACNGVKVWGSAAFQLFSLEVTDTEATVLFSFEDCIDGLADPSPVDGFVTVTLERCP